MATTLFLKVGYFVFKFLHGIHSGPISALATYSRLNKLLLIAPTGSSSDLRAHMPLMPCDMASTHWPPFERKCNRICFGHGLPKKHVHFDFSLPRRQWLFNEIGGPDVRQYPHTHSSRVRRHTHIRNENTRSTGTNNLSYYRVKPMMDAVWPLSTGDTRSKDEIQTRLVQH